MITLKDFMETVNYKITEGSTYTWNCYGPDAYSLDSWNGDQDGHSMSIIFDTKTQEVYETYVCDYKNQRAYRLINAAYKEAYNEEVKFNECLDEAWEDVKFVDLETDEDFLEKASAILTGVDYDLRVRIPLDIPDSELLPLLIAAHERDMTFNEFVEDALKAVIEKHKTEKL